MDMSQKPDGATHYVEGSISPWEKRIGDEWHTFDVEKGEWWCCSRSGDSRLETESGMAPVPIEPAPTTPTLETMLTEWRDLTARVQAAQAEADALFEHAGQCHGEIVVRLAELGWGAPRAPMVPGESVVTLDDELPANVTRYDLRLGDVVQITGCTVNKAWRRFAGLHTTVVELPAKVIHPEGDGTWLLCDGTEFLFISRPSAQQ